MFKHSFRLMVFAALLLPAFGAEPSLDALQGKWEVKKTNDEGQRYTATIESKKDVLNFRIVGDDGNTYLVAEGNLKVEKSGPFTVMKMTDIKAGGNESEMEPIYDDRVSIYQLDGRTLTLVSNMDRQRGDQKPELDVYRKAS